MKKTVTANIAGTVFHIEEDAYEQLQRYLAGIRANFSGSPGAEEIMGDIESRIAELFTERLTGRGVVTIEDVRHVEGVMGRPEDFATEGSAASANEERAASGTATGRKRFMRDPDDRWLGGVLGGFGAYIGVDALWLRIGFIVIFLAGWGTPLVLYLLLWILVPKADTAAERLMMRGEPVTVDNIKRVVEEGADRFKQGGERWAKEAEQFGKDWGPRAQGWGQDASRYAGRAANGAATVVRKLVGVFLVLVAFTLLFGLVTGLIGSSVSVWSLATWNSDGMGLLDLGALIFDSRMHTLWLGIGVFILLAVPVIALFLVGFRLLLNLRTPKWLGWTLVVLWFSALFPTALALMGVAQDFRRDNTAHSEVSIVQPAGNLLYLDVLGNENRDSNLRLHYRDDEFNFDMDGIFVENGNVYGAWAELDVEESPDSLYHLLVERHARARNSKEALARAERISFNAHQDGDVLYVSPVIYFSAKDKIRVQDAHFTLQVPVGSSVFFRPESKHIIYDVDNVTNTLDSEMIGRTWTMTRKGLQDLRGQAPEPEHPAADTTKKSPVAATVWPGTKRTKTRRISPQPARHVTSGEEASVQLPSLVTLLNRVVAL